MSIERQRLHAASAGFFDLRPPHGPNPVTTVASPCYALAPDEIDALVDTAAERTSVSPRLIRSVMRQESSFRPCAVSPKGAQGPMQLLPETAADPAITNAFDPAANVLAGATLLKQLMHRYGGDLSLTLSAYNAGPGKVDPVMGVPMIPETIKLVAEPRLKGAAAAHSASLQTPANYSAGVSAPATSFRLTGSIWGV